MNDAISHDTIVSIQPDRQEVLITRVFDAPRDRVFRAFTDPDSIVRWWGPRDMSIEVDAFDARPGGRWRFLNGDSTGGVHGFHGVFHEVAAPERLVYTFEYEGEPGHVLLETLTLEDVDGGTRVTDLSVYQSVEDRDGMVHAGMEYGVRDSYDRLAELLAHGS